jgi:FKBP-type peptidyl-prolyl cis-trans isomerase
MPTRPSIVTSLLLTALALSFSACSKQTAADKPAEKTPAAALAASAKPADSAPAAAPGFESFEQKVSYGIGYNIGTGLAREKAVTVDQGAIRTGLADGLSGAKTRIPEADIKAAFVAVQQKVAAAAAAAGEKQKTAGAEFLAKNKTRPGVKVTASGLQYEVITSGTGAKPKATDTVQVHYHGTLIDGTVFDSSVERKQPAEFPVNGVIQGWIEALQLMSVGDKWKLYIPAELGYGANARPNIPANSVLIFEVSLLAIK